MRSAADGGSAPELAVFARSPHRCLLSHPGAMAGVKTDLAPRATPRQLGYRMPAEWEPHAATWIAWPHERTDWPGKFAPIPWVYAEIVRRLSGVERVRIVLENPDAEDTARRALLKCGATLDPVDFYRVPTNRSWTRDYAPIFVKNNSGQIGITNWRFNGWAKYDDWKSDDAVAASLTQRLKLPAWEPSLHSRRVVLEGGSIDVNGCGALLTTEEGLLGPVQARNPGLSREDLRQKYHNYLGVEYIQRIKNVIAVEDSHRDSEEITRLLGHTTAVTVVEEKKSEA